MMLFQILEGLKQFLLIKFAGVILRLFEIIWQNLISACIRFWTLNSIVINVDLRH